MDSVISWAVNQALGSTKGPVVYAIYQALKPGSLTKQAAILVVVQWACVQLLGSAKGAQAYAAVAALVAASGS